MICKIVHQKLYGVEGAYGLPWDPIGDAIREIKKHQKNSDCLIISKSAFKKIIRDIFKENKVELYEYSKEQNTDNIKISKDVFIILQYFIEQYIVKILYNANFLAIHSGRVKLVSADIALISYFFNDSKNPYINNTINNTQFLDIFNINNIVTNDDDDENYEINIESEETENNSDDNF